MTARPGWTWPLLALALAGCAPQQPGQVRAERDDARCTSDLDCPAGAECFRPEGGGISGLCGKKVDRFGTPSGSIRRRVDSCRSDTDCPVRFRCERVDANTGICVQQ